VLPESRWAKLKKSEVNACANWELWRERCRFYDLPIPPAWEDFDNSGKAEARKKCDVALFGYTPPSTFDPDSVVHYLVESNYGRECRSAEVVKLGLHWDHSNTAIKKSFMTWLARQRESNPNAKCFAGKKGGNTISAWSFLFRLALLRAYEAGIDQATIRRELRELAVQASVPGRLTSKRLMEEVHDAERMIRQGKAPRSRSKRQPESACDRQGVGGGSQTRDVVGHRHQLSLRSRNKTLLSGSSCLSSSCQDRMNRRHRHAQLAADSP
jgi:hypothetical protein